MAGHNNKMVIFIGCCPESSAVEEVVPALVFGGAGPLRIGAHGRVNVACGLVVFPCSEH